MQSQRHHGLSVQSTLQFFIRSAFCAAPVILGMLWKRASRPRRFLGIALRHNYLPRWHAWAQVKADPSALRYVALSPHAKALAQDMFQALWSFLVCVIVTVMVSLATEALNGRRLCVLAVVYGFNASSASVDVLVAIRSRCACRNRCGLPWYFLF